MRALQDISIMFIAAAVIVAAFITIMSAFDDWRGR